MSLQPPTSAAPGSGPPTSDAGSPAPAVFAPASLGVAKARIAADAFKDAMGALDGEEKAALLRELGLVRVWEKSNAFVAGLLCAGLPGLVVVLLLLFRAGL